MDVEYDENITNARFDEWHICSGAGFNPDAQGWNSHTGYSVRIGGHKVTMDDDDEGSIDIKVAKLIWYVQ